MSRILDIARSALSAFQTKLGASARNLAHASNENLHPLSVRMQETPDGGVRAVVERAAHAYTVNFSAEAVNMIVAEHGFSASVKVIQAEDDMADAAMDILA